ncbi:unnamed protein product [Heligmosomoides polygyrus]|uniref:SKICH domain-containing protein n=1 Tax=Heligmosomoides polygyrus TaxID=6339 RepID=A0A3P7Y2R8_HELPZ|nr:unnamed protein product [Heligmosomoides polygyrus]
MVVEYEIFAPRYSRIMSAIDMERCEYQLDGILRCPQDEPAGVSYYVRNVYPPIQDWNPLSWLSSGDEVGLWRSFVHGPGSVDVRFGAKSVKLCNAVLISCSGYSATFV